ncbi:sensor histidine kinase [Vibrio aestuarianus]|uniref:sensor histidine kinase n=1 Tax=Vibrio aestuarianus TaxID=28171 RepID=UPI00237CF7B1|nr:sensor histidine kinase [Vibrio aestuarianus]MDE1332782.1 ATP-binding protein [Vibrio aestuarianus]
MSKIPGFRIAARALRQLGAELITSDEIALNELIKNALDAKSKQVSIKICNPFKKSRSNFIVDIEKLGKDDLLEKVKNNILDDFECEAIIETLKKKLESSEPDEFSKLIKDMYDEVCSITIEDDGMGMDADKLQNSFLVIGTPTKWIEKQAESDSELLGEKGVGRLSMMRLGRYSKVKSAVEGDGHENLIDFDWKKFDDPKLFLDQVEIQVTLGSSKSKEEHGTQILIKGIYGYWDEEKVLDFINSYIRRLQNPFGKKSRFPILIYLNGKRQPVERIYPWFKKAANFSANVKLTISDGKPPSLRSELIWRGTSSPEIREWAEQDLLRVLGEKNTPLDISKLQELGSIGLELLWFNRSDLKGPNIDHSPTQIREELDLWCGGYAIYRDNFRIGMTGSLEDDWLKVDSGSLKSQGFSFNRYQTVGALSITQKENPKLLDSANREKLINCEHLDLLKKLLTKVVNPELKSHIGVFNDNKTKSLAQEATAEETMKDAKARLKKAQKQAAELKKVVPKDKQNIVSEINHTLKTQYENLRNYERAIKLATDQRIEVLELAGLGMVVEKVVHELSRLTEKTVDNLKILEKNSSNQDMSGVISIIREQINVTNKRIRTVDALSPSGRNRKEIFNLSKAIQDVIDGFSGRLKRHNINAYFTVDDECEIKDFKVHMVKGLVALVLENLLANSIYWLQQGLVSGEKDRNIYINLDTKSYVLSVKDNGPGIEPSVKKDIFRAYYSNRPEGKGLGLFICNEVAEYHECSVYVDSEEDDDGRLRRFILELPKK